MIIGIVTSVDPIPDQRLTEIQNNLPEGYTLKRLSDKQYCIQSTQTQLKLFKEEPCSNAITNTHTNKSEQQATP